MILHTQNEREKERSTYANFYFDFQERVFGQIESNSNGLNEEKCFEVFLSCRKKIYTQAFENCCMCREIERSNEKCGAHCLILTHVVHIHGILFNFFFSTITFSLPFLALSLSHSHSIPSLLSILISPFSLSLYAFYAVVWLVFLLCICFLQRHKCYFAFSILAIHIGGCMDWGQYTNHVANCSDANTNAARVQHAIGFLNKVLSSSMIEIYSAALLFTLKPHSSLPVSNIFPFTCSSFFFFFSFFILLSRCVFCIRFLLLFPFPFLAF